jgi:general stress protein 26
MNINDVKQFLDQFHECVISTVDVDMQPESATVGLSCDENFKFMIATNQSTRKAKNLQSNQAVAIVVGFDGPKTVQIEGTAQIVDKDNFNSRIQLHLDWVPSAKTYDGEPGQTYYLITPTWLRFTDYTKSPDTFETKDFS